MGVIRGRLHLYTGIGGMIMMYIVSTHLQGKIWTTLPFVPAGFVTGMSHRGLEGDNMQECSLTFLYVLITMALRGVFGKMTGSDGPRFPMDMATP